MSEKISFNHRIRRICERMSRETGPKAVLKLADLARDFGIGLRQINSDIEHLRNEHEAPLQYDGRLRGWRFTRPFYIVRFELTQDQAAQVWVGLELMKRIGVIDSMPSLDTAFKGLHNSAREKAQKATLSKQIYYQDTVQHQGAQYLAFLLHCIEEKRQVRFIYQPFHSNESKEVVFDPWFLRYFDRRWYVGGFSHDPSELFVRTFPLDRIAHMPISTGFAAKKPDTYHPEDYWKHIYGITVPPKPIIETVELSFSLIQGKYFMSAPFYQNFEILEQSETELRISLQIMINIELIRKLASFGQEVNVIGPQSLRQRLREFHRAAADMY
jgi:predicted DNA-binding transcriptional regulator YafY